MSMDLFVCLSGNHIQLNPIITNPDRVNYAIYRTKTNQLQKYTRNIFLITKFASNISNSANPELPSHGLTAAIEMLIGHG